MSAVTLFSRFQAHLHRGGIWGYWWTERDKRSFWWHVLSPSRLPTDTDLFFGVHPTKTRKGDYDRARIADIAAINCLFADFDPKSFGGEKAQALEHARILNPTPSALVDSGGGYHGYWLLREPFIIRDEDDRERASRAQAEWVEFVGGDRGAKDLARVLRVPETVNHKAAYAPNFPRVGFIVVDWERQYDLCDLEERCASNAKGQPSTSLQRYYPTGNGHNAYARAALEDELVILRAATEGTRNDSLNKAAFELGQLIGTGELDRAEVENTLYDVAIAKGLGDRETRATIQSGLNAGLKGPRVIPAPTLAVNDNAIALPPASLNINKNAIEGCPALPGYARLSQGIGPEHAWLDTYIEFSRKWSPRSFSDFHEANGVWILSTVAARRIAVELSKTRYTNLYIALIARTSIYAKSTSAEIARETLDAAGLPFLRAPDRATPQSFLKDLVLRLPDNYDELTAERQEFIKTRSAFAGQRGWYFEEFGEHLQGMMKESGALAEFRGLLRVFDDCPPDFESSTIGRGHDFVERPYLSLLANMTPADMRPYAKRGSALWGDGYFARFAFVTPPIGSNPSRARFPRGKRIIPAEIIRPLREWHERLGVPSVHIEEILNEEGKKTGRKTISVDALPTRFYEYGTDVFDAFYNYHDALTELASANNNDDADGNYTRFAEKALRIALLLASVEGAKQIEMRHWARAQTITERCRASFHNLVEQMNQTEPSQFVDDEERIHMVVEKLGTATTSEVLPYMKRLSSVQIANLMQGMAAAGRLKVEGQTRKGTNRYALA